MRKISVAPGLHDWAGQAAIGATPSAVKEAACECDRAALRRFRREAYVAEIAVRGAAHPRHRQGCQGGSGADDDLERLSTARSCGYVE